MKANWFMQEGELGESLDIATLSKEGVLYQALPTQPSEYQSTLDALRDTRGYIEQDEVGLEPDTPDLASICTKFADEHFHDEDEVRFVLDGEGVFDIRASDDRWMRVAVESGDLIVVPAKRYHRFFLTPANRIRCIRLFQDQSGWVPHYRHANAAQ